jgi:hypothetical protein
MRIRLLSFFVLFFAINSVFQIYSQCCYRGWNYRTPLTIINNNSSQLNFEIADTINTQALISSGKMKPDGSDLRFSDSLCNNITYWIETGINTAATVIWFKVPNLSANSSRTIYMYYGNPSATAVSSGGLVFKFYEGFEGSSLQQFTQPCGAGSVTVSGGLLTMSWDVALMIYSDSVYSGSEVYTTEMKVNATSGTWPGLYQILNDATGRSYSTLISTDSVRIGASNTSTGQCQGQNFVSPLYKFTSTAGLWSITWVSTGDIRCTFPTVGTITSTSTVHTKNNFRIGIGGVAAGTGSMTVDWVRVRKWVSGSLPFVSTMGAEQTFPSAPTALTALAVSGLKINLNWTDNSSNEDKFYIQRSTNSGTNWILRDSVNAGVTAYIDNGLTSGQIYCYRVCSGNCRGNSAYTPPACDTAGVLVAVSNIGTEIPKVFALYQNYPNPFNPGTKIKFDIPQNAESQGSKVRLTIYDVLGREKAVPVNEMLVPGSYEIDIDGSNFASGIYFYRLEAGEYVNEMKMVLLK